jgi:putative hemin transport protein
LLELAADEAVAPLILVGNAGVTQAHQGPIDKVVVMGPWLNVLDAGFNLHLREDHIASAWVVVQSGLHGMFSALVLLDQAGAVIALFASANVAGNAEKAWAGLIERLPKV